MVTGSIAAQNEQTFRLQATATILVDGTEHTGTSVQEYQLQWIYEPQIGRNGAWRLAVRGEAIKVDVPGGEPIYVQLGAGSVFGSCADKDNGQDALKRSLLELDRCEVLRFPSAIRPIHGSRIAEAVHADGKDWNGYEFISLSFQRTEDEVTTGTIPPELSEDPRMVLEAPYGDRTKVIGTTFFKAEQFQ